MPHEVSLSLDGYTPLVGMATVGAIDACCLRMDTPSIFENDMGSN